MGWDVILAMAMELGLSDVCGVCADGWMSDA